MSLRWGRLRLGEDFDIALVGHIHWACGRMRELGVIEGGSCARMVLSKDDEE